MSELPNKNLGPCVVIWDGRGINAGTPLVFDKSNGGVFFRYEELRAPIKRDQAGLTDVDEVTTGAVNPELEVPLSEEEVSRLRHCFANAEAVVDTYLKVSNPVGEAVLPLARQVIAKPIVNGVISTTESEWIYIHKAFPRVTMEQVYDNAGQRGVKVIFKGFPDIISGRIHEMWRYGPKNAS